MKVVVCELCRPSVSVLPQYCVLYLLSAVGSVAVFFSFYLRHRHRTLPSCLAMSTIRQEEDEVVDLASIRAGGNTSTFDADARCPTGRAPVPYRNGELKR